MNAQLFPTFRGDIAFDQFPTPDDWARLLGCASHDFAIGLKLAERVTVATCGQNMLSAARDRVGMTNTISLPSEYQPRMSEGTKNNVRLTESAASLL
jgi:hypothetical protein